MFLYDVTLDPTDYVSIPEEENSRMLPSEPKVPLYQLRDERHDRQNPRYV